MTKVNAFSHEFHPKLPQVMTQASLASYPTCPSKQTNQAMASIVHRARTHGLAELIDLLLEVPHNVEHAVCSLSKVCSSWAELAAGVERTT